MKRIISMTMTGFLVTLVSLTTACSPSGTPTSGPAASATATTAPSATATEEVPTYLVPDFSGKSALEATVALTAAINVNGDGMCSDAHAWTCTGVPKIVGDTTTDAVVKSQTPFAGAQVPITQTPVLTMGKSAAAQAAIDAAKAEADRVAAEAAAAAAAAAAAEADPATYAAIDERTWLLVAKDPNGHAGEKYVIYGSVTQFDSATGDSAFLARTGATRAKAWYDYDVNTAVVGTSAAQLANVVEGDLVKMYVVVDSAFSYDTQIGGNTTVPKVAVKTIEVYGHKD